MSWVKLDDQFHSHPKVVEAGNEAAGVYVRSLAYCGAHNTDGFLSRKQSSSFAKTRVLARVTDAGFWEEVEPGESRTVTDRRDSGNRPLPDVTVEFDTYGFFIGDFLHHNPSKVEAEAAKEKRRSAGSKGGTQANAQANAKHLRSNTSSIDPSRPIPIRTSNSNLLPVDNFQAVFLRFAEEHGLHPSQANEALMLGPALLEEAMRRTLAKVPENPAAYFTTTARHLRLVEVAGGWASDKPLEVRLETYVENAGHHYDDVTLREELALKGADGSLIERLVVLAGSLRAAA